MTDSVAENQPASKGSFTNNAAIIWAIAVGLGLAVPAA
jgi:hypothetical protein